jgi:hypothetical protein
MRTVYSTRSRGSLRLSRISCIESDHTAQPASRKDRVGYSEWITRGYLKNETP